MTKLGIYLAQKSVNKSEVARKTGISRARINVTLWAQPFKSGST